MVELSGSASHPVAVPGEAVDAVAGTRFELSEAELAATDEYESADYHRQRVQLGSGSKAWLYRAK